MARVFSRGRGLHPEVGGFCPEARGSIQRWERSVQRQGVPSRGGTSIQRWEGGFRPEVGVLSRGREGFNPEVDRFRPEAHGHPHTHTHTHTHTQSDSLNIGQTGSRTLFVRCSDDHKKNNGCEIKKNVTCKQTFTARLMYATTISRI